MVTHVDIPVHTEDELRAAWAICRVSNWPDTFEATMQDAMRARLVDLVASGLASKRNAASCATPAHPPGSVISVCRVLDVACLEIRPSRRCANCSHKPAPQRPFTYPPGFVDRKRAAAGDRDD